MKRQGGVATLVAVAVAIAVLAAVGVLFVGGLGTSLKGGLSDVTKGIGAIQAQGSQVQITAVTLLADTFSGTEPLAPTCGASPSNSYISLTNTGGSGSVSSVTITYGGANNLFKIEGSCQIGAAGSAASIVYVLFPGPSALPNSTAPGASEPFLGTVNMSNGVKLPFSGDFQQGAPRISLTATTMLASQLSQGNLGASCQISPPAGSSYVELTNTGTEGASPQQIQLSWSGSSVSIPISSCSIGPQGSQGANLFVAIAGLGPVGHEPTLGESYSVTVTLGNGAAAPITVQSSGSFE